MLVCHQPFRVVEAPRLIGKNLNPSHYSCSVVKKRRGILLAPIHHGIFMSITSTPSAILDLLLNCARALQGRAL